MPDRWEVAPTTPLRRRPWLRRSVRPLRWHYPGVPGFQLRPAIGGRLRVAACSISAPARESSLVASELSPGPERRARLSEPRGRRRCSGFVGQARLRLRVDPTPRALRPRWSSPGGASSGSARWRRRAPPTSDGAGLERVGGAPVRTPAPARRTARPPSRSVPEALAVFRCNPGSTPKPTARRRAQPTPSARRAGRS